jgi:hypothetical protein
VLYEDRSERRGWVLGGYHFVQQNVDGFDPNIIYLQRDVGILGALRYPLDRFRRVEVELSLGGVQRYCPADTGPRLITDPTPSSCDGVVVSRSYYADTDAWRAQNGRFNFTAQPTFRIGYDTIRYDYFTGPLAGTSATFELGGGVIPARHAVHGFARFDAEHYFQLGRRANLGLRLAGGSSFAPDPQSQTWERSWWVNPPDNLRGFSQFDYVDVIGRNYYVANAELQVPLDPFLHLFIFDYVEGVAALDFGGVFDRWNTVSGAVRDPVTNALTRGQVGAWDARTLTGVLGVNLLFGPLLLRLHFGHPFNIGGFVTPALAFGDSWVTNVTLRWFFM